MVTVVAIGIVPTVIGIPAVDQTSAVGTAFVMVVIAILTKREIIRSAVVGLVDPFSAAGTDCGLLVKAGRAEQFILKRDQLLRSELLSAAGTGVCLSVNTVHNNYLLKNNSSPVFTGLLHRDNI